MEYVRTFYHFIIKKKTYSRFSQSDSHSDSLKHHFYGDSI